MSDFFGDDFTRELKNYFLDSLIAEATKFMDLIDDSLWQRIRKEVIEQTKAWAVDAKTNEFLHLMEWLEKFEERSKDYTQSTDLLRGLQALKSYAESLKTDMKDSEELAKKFTPSVQNHHQSLYLHCQWGSQEFAVPLLSVVEISGGMSLYSLPEKKQGILGVVPFRGEAIPVVDLAEHGFRGLTSEKTFYVICETQGHKICLPVSATEDLVSLKESELQSAADQGALIQVPFVRQFFIKGSRNVMILDLDKMVA